MYVWIDCSVLLRRFRSVSLGGVGWARKCCVVCGGCIRCGLGVGGRPVSGFGWFREVSVGSVWEAVSC